MTEVKTQNHDQIKKWIEARGGRPARLAHQSTSDTLAPLTVWFEDENRNVKQSYQALEYDEFFKVFDQHNLTFTYTENGDDDKYHTITSGMK